jgi:hypothetical protein
MRKSLLAALVFAVAACGGDKVTAPENINGSYTLRTVNGTNPPNVIYQDQTYKVEVTDGTLTLGTNSSWSGTLGGRITTLATGSINDFSGASLSGGTYTRSGSTLTLDDPQDQLTFTGTVSNGTITLNVDLIGLGSATQLVYTK